MKTVLVGVGQAGGRIATAISEFDAERSFGAVQGALAVNTAEADLQPLPIDTVLIGRDRVSGQGVGGDNELGAEIMDADVTEVMDALDGEVTASAESIFVVAGLGGGTGSGGAPVLVKALQRVYDIPIYALGVLPGRDEGSLYRVNAGRSLKTVLREADATLLVDNDAWQASDESVGEAFDTINQRIAERIGLLLAAGEPTGDVAETVVDTSEVINTLAPGELASVGYATVPAAEDPEENITSITSATRNAVLTQMSLPDATSGEAALLVVAGRPERIPRKGVERARRWLEDETGSMQVRGGDFPRDTDRLAALVVLSGVERSDRVDELFERARQTSTEAADAEPESDPAAAFENDDLDDLF